MKVAHQFLPLAADTNYRSEPVIISIVAEDERNPASWRHL